MTDGGARAARAVLTTDLKDDGAIVESYRAHHQQVWPEVVTSLRRAGIRRMDIYILGRRLVMILETDGRDFQQCMALHVASSPRVAEWESLMHSMQEAPPGGQHEKWWTVMEPVFSLDGALPVGAPLDGAPPVGAPLDGALPDGAQLDRALEEEAAAGKKTG
jgi:L-rhamnose mutarotase